MTSAIDISLRFLDEEGVEDIISDICYQLIPRMKIDLLLLCFLKKNKKNSQIRTRIKNLCKMTNLTPFRLFSE